MARAPHTDALSQTFSSSHTEKVAFNQAVFSDRKIIALTSKPGSDTNMAPGQSGADWTEVFNELNNAVKMRHYSPSGVEVPAWQGARTYVRIESRSRNSES